MTDYKQAGDLVPEDVYIRRRPYRDTTQDRIYRVITTRLGNAATVVEVIIESLKTGKRSASNFFRSNRVEIVPREPEESAARSYAEAAPFSRRALDQHPRQRSG